MKKTLVVAWSTFLSLSAMAADPVLVKTCQSDVWLLEYSKPVPITIEVYRNDSGYSSKWSQSIEGESYTKEFGAQVSEHAVRENLSAANDGGELNLAERLVVHAMALSSDPAFNSIFSSGIELSAVRSAKVYQIGESTRYGVAAIVEAKDASGQDLGSFFGGFLLSACK